MHFFSLKLWIFRFAHFNYFELIATANMAKWFALQTIDSNGYGNKPSQSSVSWLRNRFDFDQIFSRKQTYSACILIGWKCSIAIDIGFGGLHAEHRPDDGCHINPSITLFGYAIFMLCVCRFFLLLQTPFASHFYAFYQSISINSNSLCHICFGGLFGLEKSKHFGIKFSDDDLFFFRSSYRYHFGLYHFSSMS